MRKLLELVVLFVLFSNSVCVYAATYVVKQGDNLTRISLKISQTVDQIVAMNAIGKTDLIFPGQTLRYLSKTDIEIAELWLDINLSRTDPKDGNYRVFKQAIYDLRHSNIVFSFDQSKTGLFYGNVLGISQQIRSSAKQLITHQLVGMRLYEDGKEVVINNPPCIEVWEYPDLGKAVVYVSYFPQLDSLIYRNNLDEVSISQIASAINLFGGLFHTMVPISLINTFVEPCPQHAEDVLLYLLQRKGIRFPLGLDALQRLSKFSVLQLKELH